MLSCVYHAHACARAHTRRRRRADRHKKRAEECGGVHGGAEALGALHPHPTPSHTHILHGDGCEGGHGGGGGPGGQRGLTGDQRTKTNALNLAGDRIVKYLSHFSDIRGGVAAEGFQLPQRTLKSPRLARVLLLSMHAHAHARHVPASHARGYKHHTQSISCSRAMQASQACGAGKARTRVTVQPHMLAICPRSVTHAPNRSDTHAPYLGRTRTWGS